MIHPRDKLASNPRLQCVVCGKWLRLHRAQADGWGNTQTFYGGCTFNKGGDHLAAKPGDNDVCEWCCQRECKRLKELNTDLPDDVVKANVAFASRFD